MTGPHHTGFIIDDLLRLSGHVNGTCERDDRRIGAVWRATPGWIAVIAREHGGDCQTGPEQITGHGQGNAVAVDRTDQAATRQAGRHSFADQHIESRCAADVFNRQHKGQNVLSIAVGNIAVDRQDAGGRADHAVGIGAGTDALGHDQSRRADQQLHRGNQNRWVARRIFSRRLGDIGQEQAVSKRIVRDHGVDIHFQHRGRGGRNIGPVDHDRIGSRKRGDRVRGQAQAVVGTKGDILAEYGADIGHFEHRQGQGID